MQTKREQYIAAGLPLLPGGDINEYKWQEHLNGGIFSMKDETWVHEGYAKNKRYIGHHKCCGSKRSYRHKVNCPHLAKLRSDDLSDLKD